MADDLLAMFQALESQGAVVRENIIRAPFGYPGAKSRSLDQILPHLPYREGYGEVFGGSGAVLLARNGSPLEVFNDRYSGVTCFYRVLRDRIKMNALLDRLNMVLHSREEFLWCRNTWKNCEDEVERAARWWYMTTTSFGQQGRNFGRGVKGKAQIGPKIKTNLKFFPEVHSRLIPVQIENQDWRVCLQDFDSSDWVWYLDPPYYNYNKGMYEHEFECEEHKELLERIFHLKGFVALSGYENPLYDSYSWDHVYSWMVHVSTLGQGFTESNNLEGHEETLKRGYAREVLYIKEAS
jgi:DNA adenine methylase